MKSVSLLSAALAVGSVAAVPDAMVGRLHNLHKRQGGIGALVGSTINPGYGKVAAPAGAAPTRVNLPPKTKLPGAKTVKLRYGPYKTPNMGKTNILGEAGALWNYPDPTVEKPCAGACTIVGMVAGLEYADGKTANIDNGHWLHHMVLFSVGPGRVDATCQDSPIALPHMIIGSSAKGAERLFSSGNERTAAILPSWNMTNVGYMLKPTDKFALIVDLMNENPVDAVLYLTITYDYVDGHPAGWDDLKPVWFDVAQCLTSEWPAPYQQGKYTIPSTIWRPKFEGQIIGAAGHLHDGGQRITLDVDGQIVCSSEAKYGESAGYIGKSHGGGATEHLSSMSICVGDKLGIQKVTKDQKWKLRAEYDYDKNAGSHHGNGKQSNVMGISIMFVRVPRTVP